MIDSLVHHYLRLRREGLARLAAKLPTGLLNEMRMAATAELARRGLYVITTRKVA
jgi:hypothetical protein